MTIANDVFTPDLAPAGASCSATDRCSAASR